MVVGPGPPNGPPTGVRETQTVVYFDPTSETGVVAILGVTH